MSAATTAPAQPDQNTTPSSPSPRTRDVSHLRLVPSAAASPRLAPPVSEASKTLQINDEVIFLEPRETVLQAALRSGLEFPNSCRVGGCGACKCKLTQGKVKELTETGYLLTGSELDEGYILACQSIPETSVKVEIEPQRLGAAARVPGRVLAQHKLTHDILELTLQLETALDYRAGQFAQLRFEGLDAPGRSYSFATPPTSDGRVSFFVRRVPGGRVSGHVHDSPLVGSRVTVEGPHGDFYLRPGDAPLLLVAGGSGLAPILALLESAANEGVRRPVTLLFGAREERDLYAMDRIEALKRRWQADFRFLPVLSAAREGAPWNGARGLVTAHLEEALLPGSHAYLCGPPAMVDAAVAQLVAAGVSQEHIHFDRFTTSAAASTAPELAPVQSSAERLSVGAAVLSVLHYLKFFLFHGVGALAVLSILAGGYYITLGLVGVLALYMLGDAVAGDDTSTPTYRHTGILTVQLWLALPLLAFIVFSAVWSVSPGDPLGFGRWLSAWTGYDLLAARDATSFGHHVSTWILSGLMVGMVGTITAHELTHRTWDRLSMLIGRWLLAFSFDTTFAIEHVYGHHRYVSTSIDPATAPRGRNVYYHVLASTVKGNVSAWHIEAERLQKKHLGVFSWHNKVIRGHLMSVLLVGVAWWLGGPVAAGFFTATALWGKALLEIVNYMEHYGMVRDPQTPVQPRHSWNTNRRVSSWTMFNLTRHSHHHAQGEVPYHALRPYPECPMMINGYLTTIVVAMIPPLWHHLMTPKVLAWDRDFATAEERLLAREANRRSGIKALQDANLPTRPAVFQTALEA